MNGGSVTIDNYIAGKFVAPSSGLYLPVYNPADLHQIGQVGLSTAEDVDAAVGAASAAFSSWSKKTIKARAAIVSTILLGPFQRRPRILPNHVF